MIEVMVLRSIKSQRAYRKHRKRADKPACDFCALPSQEIIFEDEHVAVIANRFPYAVWDFCRVREHLLIVPKSHVESVADLSDVARTEYFARVSQYEQSGYNFYGRGPGSASKSIAHQHTHLIRVEPKFLNIFSLMWAFIADDMQTEIHPPKINPSPIVAVFRRLAR